jgi:N-acetylglucosamine-6-phosphate deacetylase
MKIILRNAKIYSENQVIERGFIKIDLGKITEVGKDDQGRIVEGYQEVFLPKDFHVVPGLIDVHIHGAASADIMDGTEKALEVMCAALPKEGTTSFFATTMTQEPEVIEKALINVKKYIETNQIPGLAEIVGIHLEGPFVNQTMAGAQPKQYIMNPELALFQKWQSLAGGHIKLVTLAPETPNGIEFVRHLTDTGVIASMGHTNATYEETEKAIEAGLTHVTHLFNQMRGLHHREPAAVGSALLKDELFVEMIVDGIHIHPEMVRLAYKQKPLDKMLLITDAMRAKGLSDGNYDLGGQHVFVRDGKVTLKNGTLAGSVLKMNVALKNMMMFTGCSLEEAIMMASANPARHLGLYDRKGSLASGKDADIVILDEKLNVHMTFCRGQLAFQKGEEI